MNRRIVPRRRRSCFVALLAAIVPHVGVGEGVAQQADDLCRATLESARGAPAETPWSNPVNGLQARIVLKRTHVFAGTPIISPFLELRNVTNVMNPMPVHWTRESMKFRVLDAQGRELPEAPSAHSGPVIDKIDLVLPLRSTLTFDVSMGGLGISPDKAGQLETWVFKRDDKEYYLHAVVEIPESAPERDRNGYARPWHGKIEMPRVLVPLKPDKLDPAKVGPLIQELGTRMLRANWDLSEEASRVLSLVDDPRVIPWYVKAVDSRDRALKYAALDRLAKFNSDAAIEGIKKAMPRKAGDKENDSLHVIAAEALSRSPHPEAKNFLLTLWNDPNHYVRWTVADTLGTMQTKESLDLLKKMLHDPDEGVRNKAKDSLESRTEKPENRPK